MNTRSCVARIPLILLFCILLINDNKANAQSERSVPPTSTLWASIVGSTTPSGWFLSQGKARFNRSGSTLTIELLSDQNTVTQTFKGRLTGTH